MYKEKERQTSTTGNCCAEFAKLITESSDSEQHHGQNKKTTESPEARGGKPGDQEKRGQPGRRMAGYHSTVVPAECPRSWRSFVTLFENWNLHRCRSMTRFTSWRMLRSSFSACVAANDAGDNFEGDLPENAHGAACGRACHAM